MCLPLVDQFGDHLLVCSNVPMGICCHDALVNIVCHALSQSHAFSRPGDVYLSDFQYGHPVYFDVSVRSTTQPSHISSTSSCAGIVTAAGELTRDQRHQEAVEGAGCDFVLLVVETFGVWSPNSSYHCLPYHSQKWCIDQTCTKELVTAAFCFIMGQQCLYDFTVLASTGVSLPQTPLYLCL